MFAADELVVRGIEAAPAGAGDVDLGPGVSGAMLAFGHLDITGDKSRAESPIPRCFHHEHREVAAGPAAARECLVRRLNAKRVTRIILERPVNLTVEIVQEIERVDELT